MSEGMNSSFNGLLKKANVQVMKNGGDINFDNLGQSERT